MIASILSPHLAMASALMVTALLLLAKACRHIRRTTLIAPWAWSVVSLCSILVAEAFVATGGSAPLLRYCAAVTTLCPTMALLGAKRPQDAGWQFVVISLWIVLALPAAEAAIFWNSGQFQLTGARSWFMMALIIVGFSNHILTRHGASAALVSAGQWLLLREHLPLARGSSGETGVVIGLLLMLLAIALVFLRVRHPSNRAPGVERVWLDFRDAYGTVWGLRMIERINTTARVSGWNLQLGWHGFHWQDGDSDQPVTEADLCRTLRTLLRRFVSTEWIDERIGPVEPDTSQAGNDG